MCIRDSVSVTVRRDGTSGIWWGFTTPRIESEMKMRIHIGSDHAGFDLKQALVDHLSSAGHQVTDHGADHLDPQDDYPGFCFEVGLATAADPGSLGVVIGGSGNGEQIAANKVAGIRAALIWNCLLYTSHPERHRRAVEGPTCQAAGRRHRHRRSHGPARAGGPGEVRAELAGVARHRRGRTSQRPEVSRRAAAPTITLTRGRRSPSPPIPPLHTGRPRHDHPDLSQHPVGRLRQP